MKSLFDESTYSEAQDRINKIESNKPPLWGKMTAAQMFSHTVIPFEIVLEKKPPVGKPNFLVKLLFKKMMYNDRLFRKNMPTPKPFRIEEDKNFDEEKQHLIAIVNETYGQRDRKKWPKHPIFGEFTSEQTGKILYKHLDHHLRQFDV